MNIASNCMLCRSDDELSSRSCVSIISVEITLPNFKHNPDPNPNTNSVGLFRYHILLLAIFTLPAVAQFVPVNGLRPGRGSEVAFFDDDLVFLAAPEGLVTVSVSGLSGLLETDKSSSALQPSS